MAAHDFVIPADLARAARALTQVSYKYVAKTANLDPDKLRAYERGQGTFDAEEHAALRKALEKLGAVFIEEDAHGGYGVRQKFNAYRVTRIEVWEDEGGPAAEDDI